MSLDGIILSINGTLLSLDGIIPSFIQLMFKVHQISLDGMIPYSISFKYVLTMYMKVELLFLNRLPELLEPL